MVTETDKKLTEMSLNLRSSIPKDRLIESDSFRKNKTFDFSRAGKLPNDFGGIKDIGSSSGMPRTIDLPSVSQPEEVQLEIPAFRLSKKPQSTTASSTKARFKPALNLEIQEENEGQEGSFGNTKPINTQKEREESTDQINEEKKKEEEKVTEEVILPPVISKAGDKRKKKNLTIVSEIENEEQTETPDLLQNLKTTLNPSDKKIDNMVLKFIELN